MPATPQISWRIQALDEIDSTNRLASEQVLACWSAGQAAEGLVILARRQTAGRGQHARRWESPAGGLYLSAVLETVPPDLRPCTALAAGIAVISVLEKSLPLLIRWPNDIVTPSGKKLAGVLCEAVSQGDRWAVVVGIGINVQTQIADLPRDLQPAATSLAAEGVHLSIHDLAREILQELAPCARMSLPAIIAQVRPRDALRGKTIKLTDPPHQFTGTAAGIADNGGLIIESGKKQIITERGTVQIKNYPELI